MVDRAPTEPAQWPGELREVDADLSYAAANAAHVSEQRRSTPRQPDAAAQFDRRPTGRTRRCRAGGDTATPRSSRRANRPDAARALLTMAKLEQPTGRDNTDQSPEGQSPNPLRQIELHALAAVIFHALGDDSEALRHANASAALASAQGSSESENWRPPKAAGWLMAGAEEDPAARVRILKRSCCKYDSRGPLEGRLALQASTAYLELAEPELAAYFLARATEDAGSRRFTDHFPNSVHWGQVGALLESARVTEQELRNAGASLRKLGYLPEPEHGQRFRWIDEQWSRIGSDNPDLVSPPTRRV